MSFPVPEVDPVWVVDLINEFGTAPRREALESDDPYPDVTAWDATPSIAGELDHAALVAIADALHPAFTSDPPDRLAQTLHQLLRRCDPDPAVAIRGATPQLVWSCPTPHQALTFGCLLGLIGFVDRHSTIQRLGICHADRCVDVYLDQSHNSSRRYCSSLCQTRTKVAAHRRRRRTRP